MNLTGSSGNLHKSVRVHDATIQWIYVGPCKRLRPSRPLLILTISYSCSQSVTERPTEAPSFVFIFFQIRYYSFQYFPNLRKKGNCKGRRGDFSRYYIFLFFAWERFKNKTWVLIIPAEQNLFCIIKSHCKKFQFAIFNFLFQFLISHFPFHIPHSTFHISHFTFPIPQSPFPIPHYPFPIPRFSNIHCCLTWK